MIPGAADDTSTASHDAAAGADPGDDSVEAVEHGKSVCEREERGKRDEKGGAVPAGSQGSGFLQ